jgi:CrcB protein
VIGSFILGLLVALPVGPTVSAVAGVGFCGALTTYSTFAYEVWRLAERRARLLALANVTGSIVVGLGAASLGYLVVNGLR